MTRLAQVDLYAVAPLLPGDKVAGRVAGRGEHFDFASRSHHAHSDLPIAWRAPIEPELSDPNFVDLTGSLIGRLKVMGIVAEVTTSTPGKRWTVRCVCGSYEVRRTKFIKACLAGKDTGDHEPMCDWCGKTWKLRHGIGVKRDGPLVKIEGYE